MGEDLSGFLSAPFTMPTQIRDYSDWHQGRGRYAVWILDTPCEPVNTRFCTAKAHLSDFLFKPYLRSPHISVFICGFPCNTRKLGDDYPAAYMKGHIKDLRQARLKPFEIEIGGINSFTSAPYLSVSDVESGIAAVRDLLSSRGDEIRFAPYTPHLTLGLYSRAFHTRQVTARMSAFADTRPIRWRIRHLRLATYSAVEIAGPLRTEQTVHLNG